MESVNVRNLDDIQEEERASRGTRLLSLLFASLAGAAIVTAGVVVSRKGDAQAKDTRDPLAELVAQAKGAAPSSDKLETRDVSFPGILSDHEKPTTALAAVKDERGRLLPQSTTEAEPSAPPPASDRLPVVPLPVGDLLSATPVTTAPKDGLTALAADASKLPGSTALAPAGMDGGFQLQVASFKDQPDADRLVDDLRRRGHRAYRLAAQVPERGIWHRVRIGPFKTKFEAVKYKGEFERVERVSPFVVDPDKVKQAEEIRSMRLAAREKKDKKKQRVTIESE
ncbi:MAG TPA: SPOR domain-containing protein [Polyangiaceae bacterium]|nr:SPOR domain-containing protein [Polyangiaceae bacterium]